MTKQGRCRHCLHRCAITKAGTLGFHYCDSWRVERCEGVGESAAEHKEWFRERGMVAFFRGERA